MRTKAANSSMSCSAAVSVISTTSRLATSGLPFKSEEMARSQGRSVAVRPEMLKPRPRLRPVRHLRDRLLQHVAVDEADESELLDRGDEIPGQHDLAVLADHAQQTFVMVDGAGVAATTG